MTSLNRISNDVETNTDILSPHNILQLLGYRPDLKHSAEGMTLSFRGMTRGPEGSVFIRVCEFRGKNGQDMKALYTLAFQRIANDGLLGLIHFYTDIPPLPEEKV